MSEQAGSLAGIRVLDLSRVLAGPWCGQILGDLGADVIKVESPGKGDDTRGWGPPFLAMPDQTSGHPRGESAYYLSANRNKRSIAIDFAHPEGADLIRQLADKADIVLENFKFGGLKRYGLDYASLKARNPRLVYCSITGFGEGSPYAARAGYDFVAQGMGGMMSLTGFPEGEPVKAGVAICDLFTGLYASNAVLAALRHAERTGIGQHIDLALLDSQIAMLANHALSWLVGGVVGKRYGNAHATIVPYRTFKTADGALVVAAGNDRQYQHLCDLIGAPELKADPRFATNPDRVRNREVLEPLLAEKIAPMKVGALVEALSDVGVPAGPINRIDQVFNDPHVAARGMVHHFTRENGVDVPSVGYPPHLSETPASYRLPPPRLGEHTFAVLREELQLNDTEITRLTTSGIVQGM